MFELWIDHASVKMNMKGKGKGKSQLPSSRLTTIRQPSYPLYALTCVFESNRDRRRLNWQERASLMPRN